MKKDTAVGRVYGALKKTRRWMSTWELARASNTTCVTTYLSEVRERLPINEIIQHKREGMTHLYRWTKVR